MNKDTQKILNLRNKYLAKSMYIDSVEYFMCRLDRFISRKVQKHMRRRMSAGIDKYLKKYSTDTYTLLKNIAQLYNAKEFTCRHKDYPYFCTKLVANPEWNHILGYYANIQEIKINSEKVYVTIKITCTGYDFDGDTIPFKHAIYSFAVSKNSIEYLNKFYGFGDMNIEQLKQKTVNDVILPRINEDNYGYYVLIHTIVEITKLVLMEGI